MEVMDKIAKDLEDSATRHNTKILYCHFQKLKRGSQYGLVPVKDKKGAPV